MNKHSKDAQKPIRFSVRIIFSLLMVVIGLFTINAVYARSDTDIYNYDNNHVIKQMGLLYYHYHDAREFIRDNYLENRVLSAEEKSQVEDYYKDKPEKSGDKYRGIAEGKNLIIVQIEALQQFVINKKTEEGNEITPNLNKLVKESLYFDNTYFQISSGNTSDAEFVANNSLYPLKEGSIYFRYPGNVFYSLPKTLKEKGYNTYAFHANNSSFWNRAIMYKSSGFDTFISNRDYILDEYVGWGLGDNSFYRQSLKVIDKTKPFYGFFVTLSSHYPYNFEYFENYEFNTGKYENTLLGDYLKAINYADMALGNFIDQLKESDLYDNTLLVIYGDHSAITKNHSEQLMEFIGKENSELEWIKLQKVPLIIHYPGVENGQINSIISGEIDIFPTIANLMNLNAPFTMGKDLLNSDISEGYAVLRNGSVITDKYIYLSGIMEAFDPDTENELMPEQYEQNLEKYQYELQISDIINQKDALRIIGK
jgi:lipoteichoic acid synthase